MSEVISRATIEQRAKELAKVYDDLFDACPYPLASPAAMEFAQAFERARQELKEAGHV